MGNQERGRFSDLHVVKNQGRNLMKRNKICSPTTLMYILLSYSAFGMSAGSCIWVLATRAEHVRKLGALELNGMVYSGNKVNELLGILIISLLCNLLFKKR